MPLYLVVTPERREKSTRVLSALGAGWRDGARLITDERPPVDHHPIAVWGQIWTALRLIPKASRANRPYWQIDNGFFRPWQTCVNGYYRFSYRSISPVLWPDAPAERAASMGAELKDWRTQGRHILLALPSEYFGKAVGIDTKPWIAGIEARIKAVTDRPIVLRKKDTKTPLSAHLRDCWAVVTHSSNVCVDAALAGIPAFVEPTAPTAPLGNLDLTQIESPRLTDRAAWWRSLCCQQFSLAEMSSGVAYRYLSRISALVDGKAA